MADPSARPPYADLTLGDLLPRLQLVKLGSLELADMQHRHLPRTGQRVVALGPADCIDA